MALATLPERDEVAPSLDPAPPPRKSTPPTAAATGRGVIDVARAVAVVAIGLGTAVVVGRDGSPLWQVVRLALTLAVTVAAYRAVFSPQREVRAGVAFVLGAVATGIGVGIGLPHLAKTGATLLTAAGLLVLAGGLVLAGTGGASLVAGVRRWRRLAVVPGLVVALFVAVWTLGQAVAVTNVPRPAVGAATPADYGLTYRDVAFDTADGVTLSGWYIPSADGAAVVLRHGSGSTRSEVLSQAAVLAGHGFGVLLPDARGHGRSAGRAMDFGWYGDEDTSAAVSFLAAQPGVHADRIGAVGLSMGGEEVIGAAAADPRIRAVVAEGATARVAADKAWQSERFGWRGVVQRGIDALTYGVTDLLTAAEPPTSLHDAVAAAAPRPVLLIAAGGVAAEGDAGRYIRQAAPTTVTLWVVPGAAHTDGFATAAGEWERRVTTFLTDALADEPG